MNIEFNSHENLITDQSMGKENIERIEKEISQFKNVAKTNFEDKDCKRILNALDLMLSLHCEQEDRIDGKPYIIHPLEVADDLINKYNVNDPDLIIAALLHDSVEDQIYKLLDIESSNNELKITNKEELRNNAFSVIGSIYGKKVENIIKELTNPDFNQIIKELKLKGIQKNKTDLYEEHIKEVIKTPNTFVVKLSDFMRNAGNIPKEGQKRDYFIKKYGPVIKNIFIPVFEKMSDSHPLYEIRNDILAELNNLYRIDYEKDTG